MGIPDEYYRRTGETLRQACERMCHTHFISHAAQLIGFSSSAALRYALHSRGIHIHWHLSDCKPPQPNRQAPRIPEAIHQQYFALRRQGALHYEASSALGYDPSTMRRSLRHYHLREYEALPNKRGARPKHERQGCWQASNANGSHAATM